MNIFCFPYAGGSSFMYTVLSPPEYEYFDDGHFFIHDHSEELAEYIIEKLSN